MKPALSQMDAERIYRALDEIRQCSDALYKLLNENTTLETRIGFSPSHTLNSAVGLIGGRLDLAGYKRPEKGKPLL